MNESDLIIRMIKLSCAAIGRDPTMPRFGFRSARLAFHGPSGCGAVRTTEPLPSWQKQQVGPYRRYHTLLRRNTIGASFPDGLTAPLDDELPTESV
jgi:hypothetical protein